MVALPACHVRVAAFGVRQHGYRTSRASCRALVTPFTLLVTGVMDALVTILWSLSVIDEITSILPGAPVPLSGGLAIFPTGSLLRGGIPHLAHECAFFRCDPRTEA